MARDLDTMEVWTGAERGRGKRGSWRPGRGSINFEKSWLENKSDTENSKTVPQQEERRSLDKAKQRCLNIKQEGSQTRERGDAGGKDEEGKAWKQSLNPQNSIRAGGYELISRKGKNRSYLCGDAT